MNADPVKSSRFYSLDALRGVAALCVVFWHWQHFFYAGTKPGHVDLARLPFERWFHLAYVRGELAVDLFFCLSGFIFYWLYADRVSRRTITGGHFAWLRFSRLYPLHLATLALVAVGQRWMMKTQGCYFVYDQNDKLHFAYNLFLVSGWGVERGFSFNGPIWSVSVEVFLYGLFFAACRLLPVRAGVLAGLAALGLVLQHACGLALGRGMLSFFTGGCVYFLYRACVRSPQGRRLALLAGVFAAGAWVATFAAVSMAGTGDHSGGVWTAGFGPAGALVGWAVRKIGWAWPNLVLFPATILALALAETRRGTVGRRLAFLGDVSYSSYLLHFPLQLAVVIALARSGGDAAVYYSPGFMAAFFAVLLVLALGSYHFFEMPAQRFLRRWGRRPG